MINSQAISGFSVSRVGNLCINRHMLLVLMLSVFVFTAFAANTFAVTSARADDLAAPQTAEKNAPKGWTNIMPPEDLKGWYRVSVPPGAELGRAQWHVDVANQILICDGDGGHDMLLTDKEYDDAIFHFECRYTRIEGKKGYNSGAYVRNSKEGKIWHQAQFGDANGGFLFGVTTTVGGQTKFFKVDGGAGTKLVKPAGQWNTMEITARGKSLTLRINGEIASQYDDCGIKSGHVGLEGEGYRIEFRNLRVKGLR